MKNIKGIIPKIISMYLPQFHQIPQNDKWWGEGYTEWTAVCAARPLFEGHMQPKVPLARNYYNLLDKDTMRWQASLMHKYGIYGMCFYHYYFGDGVLVLEKPAENLLRWKDIDMPFCFSWANESWVRTWSKYCDDRNTWNDLINGNKEEEGNGVLLMQSYGSEKEWEQHFMYLLPFFKDDRYISIDNKPVFVFHRATSISCLSPMIELWNRLAIDNGLPGIYFISTNRRSTACDAELLLEPGYSINRMLVNDFSGKTKGISRKCSYEEIYKKCLQAPVPSDRKVFLGVISGYDDTPRRGSSGMVLDGFEPRHLKNYLHDILVRSRKLQNEFVFVNAWNEWGEGMYLEPDETYGYEYLEAVKEAIETMDESEGEIYSTEEDKKDSGEYYIKKIEQYDSYWRVFDKWMVLKEKNIPLIQFFTQRGHRKIGIYGLGMFGRHLLVEIPKDRISYGIDGRAETIQVDFPMLKPTEDLLPVDAIVVTVVYDFDKIYRLLSEKIKCPIYSLEYVIDQLQDNAFKNDGDLE